MEFDFDGYINAFNMMTEEETVETYFTEDCVVDGPAPPMNRDQWLGLLKFAHNGVTERLVPRVVVREGDHIMAEVDAEFTAFKDHPDFIQKPLKAGEFLRVRFFALYKIRDGKIARIALAWWPPPGARPMPEMPVPPAH